MGNEASAGDGMLTIAETRAVRLAQILDQIAGLEAEAREIKAYLAETLGHGQHRVGAGKVIIRPDVRFSARRAAEVLDSAQLRLISELVPTAAAARHHLSEEDFRKCQAVSSMPRVTVS